MAQKPVFMINGDDYTEYVLQDGIKPVISDVDADGSGRNILNALMYRSMIAQKRHWSVSFINLTGDVAASITTSINSTGNYMTVVMVDPETNTEETRTYYKSEIQYGTQGWDGTNIIYKGATLELIER